MLINKILKEIETFTQVIIDIGLSVEERWPIRNGVKIIWQNMEDISTALKKIPYEEKYYKLYDKHNYNIKMLDGALIQLLYEFNQKGNSLISHRLAFFPSPSVKRYDSEPEEYEKNYFGSSEFHDLIEKNTTAFPIRFDYCKSSKLFKEINHPYSHVHFGEYEYCRIPVASPLTPNQFFSFIIRNFYNYAIREKGLVLANSRFQFDFQTITDNEKKILHFSYL